jgi:hypothetical protein
MRWTVIVALVAVSGAMACSTMQGAVRARAAKESGCPEESIEVEDLGSGGYRATGCDLTAVYDCAGTYLCVKQGQTAPAESASNGNTNANASPASTTARVHPPKELLCDEAFNHVYELSGAWAEWHPDRAVTPVPLRDVFLGVCHDLSMQQQACLVMPWGRTHRATCVTTLDALSATDRDRLDELFLVPSSPTTAR